MSASSAVAFVRSMGKPEVDKANAESDIELGPVDAAKHQAGIGRSALRAEQGPYQGGASVAPALSIMVRDGLNDGVASRFSWIPRPAHTFITRSAFFTERELHAHPGVFEEEAFVHLLDAPALYLSRSDIEDGSVETQVQGIAFRLKVRTSFFSRDIPFITRGTRIVYNNVDSLTVSYFVTWLRFSDGLTSFVQVNAFLLDQRTHHPYSPTWPALLLAVPAAACIAPYAPLLTSGVPTTPPYTNTLQTMSVPVQDLETIRNTSVFRFIWAKYFSSK